MSIQIKQEPSSIAFKCKTEVILETDVVKAEPLERCEYQEKDEVVSHIKLEYPTSRSDKPEIFLEDCKYSTESHVKDDTSNLSLIKRNNNSNNLNKVQQFICDMCHKEFISKENLKNHIINTHTNKLPYMCNICNKGFKWSCYLLRHSLIHTGEKPYKCDLCKRSFNDASNWRQHRLIHTGKQPYKCIICNKDFIQLSHLHQHSFIHTGEKPYKCNVCKKGFIRSSDLRRHSVIHTGEKPHICNVCKKGFTRLSTLHQHSLIHSREEP